MALEKKEIRVDLCVVGGIAGTFAAIFAARQGVRVALVNERPVLGAAELKKIAFKINSNYEMHPFCMKSHIQ